MWEKKLRKKIPLMPRFGNWVPFAHAHIAIQMQCAYREK